MTKKMVWRLALASAAVGLMILLAVVLSGSAYPQLLFRVGAPVGLVFVFAGILLLFISWLWEIRNGIKEKRYLWAALVAILGLIVIIRSLVR